MGLERLKSAFSDIIHTSEIEGRHGKSPTTNTPFLPGSILEATTYAWNSILDEPIDPAGGIEPFDAPLLADVFNNPNKPPIPVITGFLVSKLKRPLPACFAKPKFKPGLATCVKSS